MYMKNIFKIGILATAAMLALSCDDAKYGAIHIGEGNAPRAYFVEGVSNSIPGIQSKALDLESGKETKLSLQVALSEASDRDEIFRAVIDETVLDKFNLNNNTSHILIPTENVIFGEDVTIPAGENVSKPLTFSVIGLEAALAANPYAIPIKLMKVEGKSETTSTSGAYLYTVTPKLINELAGFNGASGLVVNNYNAQYQQWTLEVRFQVSNTGNRNRDVFSGGKVLMRFEDPNPGGVKPDIPYHSLVQFQGDGGYLNPNKHFETNKWQHLACTWDGKTITIYVNGEPAGSKDFDNKVVGDSKFPSISWMGGGGSGDHGLGSSWWSGCKILATEARMWSVCRSADQIKNSIKSVDSKSAGLEGYWRFSKATLTEYGFEDLTGNGHYCRTNKPINWVPNVNSNDEATPWTF